jgi:hypothetical protein
MPSDEELDLITWESEGGPPARETTAESATELIELFRRLAGNSPDGDNENFWQRQQHMIQGNATIILGRTGAGKTCNCNLCDNPLHISGDGQEAPR